MAHSKHSEAGGITGVCPPLVDIHYYSSRDEWQELHDNLAIEGGSFHAIDEIDFPLFAQSIKNKKRTIKAGSSILGILAATPNELRNNGDVSLLTALPSGTISSPERACILDACERLKIDVRAIDAIGKIAVSHTLIETEAGHRSFIKEPGISEAMLPHNDKDILAVDMYEIATPGKLSTSLREQIARREKSVLLMLGSHSIITPSVSADIFQWSQQGKLHTICGNDDEFRQLLTPDLFEAYEIQHRLRELSRSTDLVVTHGKEGATIYSSADSHYADAPNIDPISTSGAGDALAGRYIGRVLQGEGPDKALSEAVSYASTVASSLDDILFD